LKPQNIGFTTDGCLKLFDFGLAACVKKRVCTAEVYEMTGYTGTLAYMAPEVALNQPYSEKVDIYSFGMILWQMLSGEVPFLDVCREDYMQQVVLDGQRPAIPRFPSCRDVKDWDKEKEHQQWKGLVQLIQLCWDPEPSYRPTAAALMAALELIISGKPLQRQPSTASLFTDNWRRFPIIM